MTPDVYKLPLDQLPDPLPIIPVERPFDVTIRPPGSKSITNRALLLAALAKGTSELRGALVDADDAKVMVRALEQLGAKIEISGETVRVTGVDGQWKIRPGETVRLDLHNAGTATRFLAAAAMLAPAGTTVVIDGDARMRERPIGELVDALRLAGAEVAFEHRNGFPPLGVRANARGAHGQVREVRFGATSSSQFISAMFMAAPFLERSGDRLEFAFDGPLTSEPYLRMTLGLMESIGFRVEGELKRGVRIGMPAAWGGSLPGFAMDVEPDASGATYFLAAASLVAGSRCTIEGIGSGSLQGDAGFAAVLGTLGADHSAGGSVTVRGAESIRGGAIDLADMPDTAMTAAVVACFASPTANNVEGESTLRGLRTLRVKETDRLEALRAELTKIGAVVEIVKANGGDEGLKIRVPLVLGNQPIYFDTYNDHRMAMALALVGLRRPNVFIRNPACVAKTYPTYWRDFAKLYEQ